MLFYTRARIILVAALHIFFFFFFLPVRIEKIFHAEKVSHPTDTIYREEEEELFRERELFEDAWKCIILSRIVIRSNGIADM